MLRLVCFGSLLIAGCAESTQNSSTKELARISWDLSADRSADKFDWFDFDPIRGAIDGQFVNFLVDTGASVVAMSARHARSLGLDCASRGRTGTVQTAQGSASACFLNLSQVTVGGITGHNVQAAVIDGDHPVDILLGMSFLRQVALEERAGVLTLTAKY